MRRVLFDKAAGSLLALLVLLPATASCQAANPGSFEPTTTIDMMSPRRDLHYRLSIAKPAGPPPQQGFPVIYVLDGSWYFELVRQTATILMRSGDMPRAVLVGVGYDDPNEASRLRVHDFTTPGPQSAQPPQWATWKAEPGGASEFLSFMTEQVRPRIARDLSVNTACQVLAGHSLGGLFAVYSLFREPFAYRAYIIGDPSVWWNGNDVLRGFDAFASVVRSAGKPIDVRVINATSPSVMPGLDSLQTRLTGQSLPGVTVSLKALSGETHNSMLPGFFSIALREGLACGR